MGWRFRKSINLGGGFRINISKSGIGYSWGCKGYRITKTAKGTVRRTLSIPGTGISHVTEGGKQNQTQPIFPESQEVQRISPIQNNDADMLISFDTISIIDAVKKSKKWDNISTVGIILFFLVGILFPPCLLLCILSIALKIFVRVKGTIDLEYEMEDGAEEPQIDKITKISTCKKVWRIISSSTILDRKRNAGASTSKGRVACTVLKKLPFPLRSNYPCIVFKSKREQLIFLPDKLFVIQGGKIGALNYDDIDFQFNFSKFIEDGPVPQDAQVIGKTWAYTNKSGGPDRRFKNNREIPICQYGELTMTSENGLYTVFMFSDSSWMAL